jgi:hypothetical protein
MIVPYVSSGSVFDESSMPFHFVPAHDVLFCSCRAYLVVWNVIESPSLIT